MDEDLGLVISICVVIIPILAYLAYALYFRVQARIHEFMLTLVVSTMPLGLLMMALREVNRPEAFDRVKAILAGLFPMMMLFGGSLWGLSVARRKNEDATWPRLRMLILGWLITPAVFLLFLGATFIVYLQTGSFELWMLRIMPFMKIDWMNGAVLMTLGVIPFIVAIWVELKSRGVQRTR